MLPTSGPHGGTPGRASEHETGSFQVIEGMRRRTWPIKDSSKFDSKVLALQSKDIRSSDARIPIATPITDPSHHSTFEAEPPRITDDYKGTTGQVAEHETGSFESSEFKPRSRGISPKVVLPQPWPVLPMTNPTTKPLANHQMATNLQQQAIQGQKQHLPTLIKSLSNPPANNHRTSTR